MHNIGRRGSGNPVGLVHHWIGLPRDAGAAGIDDGSIQVAGTILTMRCGCQPAESKRRRTLAPWRLSVGASARAIATLEYLHRRTGTNWIL